MPTYQFRCCVCNDEFDAYMTFTEYDRFRTFDSVVLECMIPDCYGIYERVISSPSFHRGFSEGFNPSTGSYVSSSAQFRSELSAASDAASLRTGIPHNFQPLDPRDPVAAGVTEDGMDATYAAQTASGEREAKKFL
jgi:hypothetical protein